jgi:hypothetical protein
MRVRAMSQTVMEEHKTKQESMIICIEEAKINADANLKRESINRNSIRVQNNI